MSYGDFGQYTRGDVFKILKSRKGSGTCERCGKPTRTNTIFGMTICNACWSPQHKK